MALGGPCTTVRCKTVVKRLLDIINHYINALHCVTHQKQFIRDQSPASENSCLELKN